MDSRCPSGPLDPGLGARDLHAGSGRRAGGLTVGKKDGRIVRRHLCRAAHKLRRSAKRFGRRRREAAASHRVRGRLRNDRLAVDLDANRARHRCGSAAMLAADGGAHMEQVPRHQVTCRPVSLIDTVLPSNLMVLPLPFVISIVLPAMDRWQLASVSIAIFPWPCWLSSIVIVTVSNARTFFVGDPAGRVWFDSQKQPV